MSESKAKASRKTAPVKEFDGRHGSNRPTQQERLLELVNKEIDRIKLADTVPYADVIGPTPIAAQGTVIPMWTVIVSLKHNMLLGQPPIVVANSLSGDLMPPDDEFRKITALTLEQARQERDKRNAGR